ncbi:aldo/keto reductase [Nocardioidaceae bacterium]|nr:aldo/keto reductase [Nocardioidaceae bacterium]
MSPAPPPSRLGLGLAAVGRPAYITATRASLGEPDTDADRSVTALRDRSHALLDHAYAHGVRYLDVARSYGRAEEFLAAWFDARPEAAADCEVGSKWGYTYTGGWRMDGDDDGAHEVKDLTRGTFDRQLGQTRTTLGDRLAVHHVHSATTESGVLDDEDVLAGLRDLAAEGVRIGISTSGPDQAATVEQALRVPRDPTRPVADGGPLLITSVESTWNLLEPAAGPSLARAAEAGVRVIVKEVVANGRLAPTDEAHAGADAIAAELGVPLDQLATLAALAQPWAWRVLSGAVTVDQLASNLAAERLPTTDLIPYADRLDALAEPPEDYWTARSRRSWS